MGEMEDLDLTDVKWHSLSAEEVLKLLGSTSEGLSNDEVAKRLQIYGYNEIEEKRRKTALNIFLDQFKSFLVGIPIFAIMFSLFMKDYIDVGAITAILLLNAVLGTFQEYRAEKSLEALKKLAAPRAKARREGIEVTVPAKELVPGDIVILKAGDKVPADCRLIESYNLRVDEAILTGESVPVEKDASVVLDEDVTLPERRNMVLRCLKEPYRPR